MRLSNRIFTIIKDFKGLASHYKVSRLPNTGADDSPSRLFSSHNSSHRAGRITTEFPKPMLHGTLHSKGVAEKVIQFLRMALGRPLKNDPGTILGHGHLRDILR